MKRPVVKMTAKKIVRAKGLYEQGWSTQRIGREFGLSQSTVCKALRREGMTLPGP